MMDWNSILKMQEQIKKIIDVKIPDTDPAIISSLSFELTRLVQKLTYDYSGCKIPFNIYNEIHAKWRSGEKQKDLAKEYRLPIKTVNKICNDKLIVRKSYS